MTKKTLVKVVVPCSFVLVAVVGATAGRTKLGYAELTNGRGGSNVEAVNYTEEMGFDKARSLKAFQETLYPVLRANCSGCHSTENKSASGAQAPLHADVDVNVAHEYALTRVNFRDPEHSKLVERMSIDRHNCFGENCGVAAEKMLAAVTAWRDKVADMIPAVPRGVDAAAKVTEAQISDWIAADKAKTREADKEFIEYVSFHALQNAGVSSQNLNTARAGLSKALNTAARWAPKIVNPVDVNGKGILYKLDTRDYWGYTLIDTSAPDGARLPKGENGADAWKNDPDTVKRVRELYKPSSVMREKIENDRRQYLNAMAQVKDGMVLGVDKNLYVEPAIWTIEWAQKYYKYPVARSN